MADSWIPKDLLYGELVQGNCPRERPQLLYKDICKRDLKDLKRWETLTSEHSAWRCIMASPILKRPLSSRPRQRGSHKSSKIRELNRGQVVFVFSVEGIVTLEFALLATLDIVPSPPYRARYHSLSRLKDA